MRMTYYPKKLAPQPVLERHVSIVMKQVWLITIHWNAEFKVWSTAFIIIILTNLKIALILPSTTVPSTFSSLDYHDQTLFLWLLQKNGSERGSCF